mmetsp:Transcript_17383/g.30334  ORF Transcript_17383/g.30334 Transcript_17383/m.30334 type:complete len:759 (+) Transcript_17383:40-2316(+)
MQLRALAVIALIATSFSTVNGAILLDDDQNAVHTRRLVTSRRGLQVGDKYVAIVKAGANTEERCAEIQQDILDWKAANDTSVMDYDPYESSGTVHTATISRSCNVFFDAPDQTLVDFVSNMDGVEDVIEDKMVVTAGAPASWGLDRIDQADLPLSQSTFTEAYTGKGVNIYILDTGVNYNHNDFGSRASLAADFTSEDGQGIADGNGHGSHCSGTAAGSSYGIAKEANILGVKVLTSSGSGASSDVITGIAWAVQNQKDYYDGEPAVLSLSLGGGKSKAMKNAVNDAVAEGMIVVVAAGNDATDACNSSPSDAGGSADDGGVITVGATTKTDGFASYSNYGSCVDLLAPGSSIKSTYKGSTTSTATMSGTSMATPHVAGVAAVLLEKHNKDSASAQTELISLLQPNKISGVPEDTLNRLLQVPVYTGPPTPPTVSPTMPPTAAPDAVCVSYGSSKTCYDFAQSSFGGDFPSKSLTQGTLVSTDDMLCSKPSADFTGKVVLVQRGDCTFFDKVKYAEAKGAIAVIIRLVDESDIFVPTYYGNENVDILSVMVSQADGLKMVSLAAKGGIAKLGSPSYDVVISPTPYPTSGPTQKPTPAPTVVCTSQTSKSKCNKYSYCTWDTSSSGCYNLETDDVPCSLLPDSSSCNSKDGCSWALIPEESAASACYDESLVPSDVDQSTPSCTKMTNSDAESTCEAIGESLCTSSQLLYADKDTTCKFNTNWVWSSTSCGNNKFYQVKYSSGSIRCIKYTGKAGTRCC